VIILKIKSLNRVIKYILIIAVFILLIIIVLNSIIVVLKIIYPIKYKEYVNKYSEEYRIEPYLVFSIIKAESGFDPQAVSSKDARGLMQITKSTGNWAAYKMGLEEYTFESLHDPEMNIRIGCWYIRWLKNYFNENNDLVIAAYNSGSGNVSGWLKDKSLSRTGNSLEKIPFKETERFLKKVKSNYSMYKKLYEN